MANTPVVDRATNPHPNARLEQNPDSPGERERIETMGGFVSDPEEPGASSRVWLDKTRTLVGLAMARSIGDLAVKRVSQSYVAV